MGNRIPAAQVRIKRAYAAPAAEDGARILVDRLWPRGLRKADACIDHWCKELSPSNALREWFGHEPARWAGFRRRYAAELRRQPDALKQLRRLAASGVVTLVYAARDDARNNAVALRLAILGRLAASAGEASKRSAR